MPKCKTCGSTDENNKTTIPATGHRESTKHPHQCEDCDELLIDSPLQDLAHSYWYLNDELTIHFGTFDESGSGTYQTYRGHLTENGFFVKKTEDAEKEYFGTCICLPEYNLFELTDTYCKKEGSGHGYQFSLTYEFDSITNTYTLKTGKNGYLFYQNKNCTLTFAGYEL